MKPRYIIIPLILIVVVALVLPALMSVSCGGGRKLVKSKGVCKAFEVAVNNFENEYGYLPYGASMKDPKKDLSFRSDSDFMAVIAGREDAVNFKQIRFFAQPLPKGNHKSNYQDGMHVDGQNVFLYDPWGNPYYVIIDYDGDKRIQHPYKKGEVITGKMALIYSAGPDGKIGTKKENRDNPSNF